MKAFKAVLAGLAILLVSADLTASGPVGVYAVVDKVILEPNAQSPDRIQVWGAFAFVDGGIQAGEVTTSPQRGYFYFTMPPSVSDAQAQTIRKEWADLNAVAGTGQAIAFGNWSYIGSFGVNGPTQIFASVRTGPNSSRGVEIRVQDGALKPSEPVPYVTNTGIVKLSTSGSHAAIAQRLKDSLKR